MILEILCFFHTLKSNTVENCFPPLFEEKNFKNVFFEKSHFAQYCSRFFWLLLGSLLAAEKTLWATVSIKNATTKNFSVICVAEIFLKKKYHFFQFFSFLARPNFTTTEKHRIFFNPQNRFKII